MGRRPHVLIQEFFDRGPKLDDNSNRYQHTCKRCGEFFPKGRIDSLTTHLLRRCSNLTSPDRTWVLQQLQPDIGKPSRPAKRSHSEALQEVALPEERSDQADSSSPFLNRSALETLAEVSGQHAFREDAQAGVLTHLHRPQSNANTVAEAIAEQALLVQLQDQVELNDRVSTTPGPAPNDHTYDARPSTIHQESRPNSEVAVPHVSMPASPLVPAAIAASRHLEPTQPAQPLLDIQCNSGNTSGYQSFNAPLDLSFQTGIPSSDPGAPWTQPAASNSMQSFGSLAMPHNDPMTGYGILANSAKQKPRGRFDDARRKEVSKLRKQGACIRCRMLKKPCSGETPCKTCANVESARIWKGKCVRARLSDEMTLWSRHYFQARAQGALDAAAHGLHKDGTRGQLEVQFSSKSKPISLPVRRARRPDQECDGSPRLTEDLQTDKTDLWLLDADENTGEQLGAHARAVMQDAVNAQSVLTRDILMRTHELCAASGTKPPPADLGDNDQQRDTTRSSYSPQNELPTNVLELWASTNLLTSNAFDEVVLTVSDDPPEADGEAALPQAITPASPNHHILRAQLSAALEARCSKLSKTALNELERRLLQRQQTSRFATLLSALVLLSAVERMAGYLRSASPGEAEPATGPSDPPAPPLHPPSEAFAGLLASLLRMRALPPKTRVSPTGTLESIREFRVADGEGREAAAEWLDALALDAGEWAAKRDAGVPRKEEGVEAWEGRYVARVLLPEKDGR